jgi:hypothetical protein
MAVHQVSEMERANKKNGFGSRKGSGEDPRDEGIQHIYYLLLYYSETRRRENNNAHT